MTTPGTASWFAPDLLVGDVAVVTGGGSGIGYAIAHDFLACGATVVITSRSIERLEKAQASLAAATGRLCGMLPCDVRDESAVDRLHDFVFGAHGVGTIVVNSAAANFSVRAERMTRRALASVVDTNLYGTFLVSTAFVADMISVGRGTILNIALPAPERGFPGYAHSGATKAAIVSLTASWAREWGRYGIRVNAIGPGPVPTEGVAVNMLGLDADSMGDAFAAQRGRIPLGRLGTTTDVSAAAVFLCSPAAAWVTGQNLVVDGGLSINGQ